MQCTLKHKQLPFRILRPTSLPAQRLSTATPTDGQLASLHPMFPRHECFSESIFQMHKPQKLQLLFQTGERKHTTECDPQASLLPFAIWLPSVQQPPARPMIYPMFTRSIWLWSLKRIESIWLAT